MLQETNNDVYQCIFFLRKHENLLLRNSQNSEYKNIYGMLLCCKEKANKARENYTANRNGNQFVALRFACVSWTLL